MQTMQDQIIRAFVGLFEARQTAAKAPKRVHGRFTKRAKPVGPTSVVDYVAIRTGQSHARAQALVAKVGV